MFKPIKGKAAIGKIWEGTGGGRSGCQDIWTVKTHIITGRPTLWLVEMGNHCVHDHRPGG